MKNLGVLGVVGTTVILVVGVTAIGGGMGAPMAVDSYADQKPNGALYGVEKFGESVKMSMNLTNNRDLYKERMQEWVAMVKENKGTKYMDVMSDGQQRLMKVTKRVRNRERIQTAKSMVSKHISTLENVKAMLPENAMDGINQAISSSSKVLGVLDNVEGEVGTGKIPGEFREQIKNQVDNSIEETKEIGKPEGIPGR